MISTDGMMVVAGSLAPFRRASAVIFTASLCVFGWTELLGHLPFYGIFFLLFIAPKADSRRVRGALQARA